MSAIDNFISNASRFLGQPYRWGGGHAGTLHRPAPVDCSGLVSQAAQLSGLKNLTGTAAELQRKGSPVSMSCLKPGDLVFKGHPAHHVAIYVGRGKVMEAPRTGSHVKFSSVAGFTSARRAISGSATMARDHANLQSGRSSNLGMPQAREHAARARSHDA